MATGEGKFLTAVASFQSGKRLYKHWFPVAKRTTMRTALRHLLTLLVALSVAKISLAQDMPGRGDMAINGGQAVRGTVTAAAADHLTMKTDAGETWDVAISANTRVMKDRQPVKAVDIKAGDGVGAMGEVDAAKKTVHALFVAIVDAEQVKKLREGLGKEYIAGKVTAIDEVKLTIQRSDNVTQVIEVDETTSFRKGGRRVFQAGNAAGAGPAPEGGKQPVIVQSPGGGGGESITLADIKVGDMVAGQGSVKHGVFVPTTLNVMPPGAAGAMGPMGGRMRRGNGEGAPTPATPSAAPKQ
jgi:preprotein translocase subunit YajC